MVDPEFTELLQTQLESAVKEELQRLMVPLINSITFSVIDVLWDKLNRREELQVCVGYKDTVECRLIEEKADG